MSDLDAMVIGSIGEEVGSMARRRKGGGKRHTFGGDWTGEKLAIVADYLQGYTIALKNTRFRKGYIDAFAGTASVIESRAADEPRRIGSEHFMEDRLRRLVRRAVDKELISLGRAAEILGITHIEMRKLAASWVE